MKARIPTPSALNQRATQALVREIGVVDTIRFLNQFRTGSGDYTKERRELFRDKSVKDIFHEIRERRDK